MGERPQHLRLGRPIPPVAGRSRTLGLQGSRVGLQGSRVAGGPHMGQHLGPAEGAYINTTKGKAMADSNVTASRGSADVKLLATCWTSAGDSSPLYDSKVSPVDVFARVESVARAGFKGMGLTHADVQAARDHHGSGVLGRLKQSCSNAGIEFFEIEFLTGWYSDDAELRRGAVLKLAELLAWAGELGAEQIKIGGSASVPGRPQPKVSMIGDAFGGICERAAAAGVRLALEPQPWTDISHNPGLTSRPSPRGSRSRNTRISRTAVCLSTRGTPTAVAGISRPLLSRMASTSSPSNSMTQTRSRLAPFWRSTAGGCPGKAHTMCRDSSGR